MNLLTGAKNPVFAIDALAAQGDRISTTLHMGQSTKSGFRAVLANVKYMARTIGLRNTMIQRTDIMTASALTHYFRHALRKNGCRRADFEIVPGAVSPDEYTAIFRRLDCAILPYSVSWYARKGSGVMFESLAEGIIPIAPLGTSMAALMQDAGVGVVYSAGDPEDFRNAIATMVEQFEHLSRASQTYAPIYRASNSPQHALAILTCD